VYCVYCSLLSTAVTLSLCMCVHVVVSNVQTCSNLLHCLFKFKLKYFILLFLCFISKLWQYCIIYSHAKKTILNLNLNSELKKTSIATSLGKWFDVNGRKDPISLLETALLDVLLLDILKCYIVF